MAHLLQSVAVVFFWLLSAIFALGLLGCAFVVILTSVDDFKEILSKDKSKMATPTVEFAD